MTTLLAQPRRHSLRSAASSSSSPTVFSSHTTPATSSSSSQPNSIFLSHHSSSNLPNAVCGKCLCSIFLSCATAPICVKICSFVYCATKTMNDPWFSGGHVWFSEFMHKIVEAFFNHTITDLIFFLKKTFSMIHGDNIYILHGSSCRRLATYDLITARWFSSK